ncbi:MAG: sulfite exporter TauE/SafE family protein [Moraxella sp.]|nr:sulfite exporter TauE/SafE family protein [Moraxella sp.]
MVITLIQSSETMSAIMLAIINFFTSTMTAITGMGGGMILVGLMPLFLPAAAIVPVHGATQLASNISRAWFGRKHIDLRYFWQYFIGTMVGVAVFGVAVRFVKLDLIPLFIAIYILLTQWSKTIDRLLKSLENFYLVGFVQTGIGLFVGSPGPLHMPLLMKKYKDNHVIVTTGSLMLALVHFIKLVVYIFLGFAFADYWQVIVMMIASAVIGSWIGVKLRHHLPMAWLKTALPWLLTIIAFKIIVDNMLKFGWVGF